MNSLPNYLNPYHTQKSIRHIDRSRRSVQTVILDDPDFNLTCFNKNKLNYFRQGRARKGSNILEWVIKERNMNNIFLSVLKNIFFPNFVAFSIICLVMKFEDYMKLNCFNQNKNVYSYFIIHRIIFEFFFLFWGVELCFFFEEKNQKLFVIFSSFSIQAIMFAILYSDNTPADFIFFTIPLMFQIILYLIIKVWQRKLDKIVWIRIGFVIFMFFFLFLDLVIIRLYLVGQIYTSLKQFSYNKILFQCFLFFYYQIYGKVFLSIIARFRSSIPKNLFLFSIKYYIMNVLSSCTTLSIVYSEEKYISLFAVFNFLIQLLSLYMQGNIFLQYSFSILRLFKKKRNKAAKDKKDANSDIKSIIAGLTNETMYEITFTLMAIIIFDRDFIFQRYYYYKSCVRNFNGVITFIPYVLCILFAINFFYFFYLLFKLKDDKKIKFLWKRENYSFLVKIYLIILFQGNADMNFQFFIYLYILDKKIC